jgi:chromosome segregation ATPase
MALFGRSNKQRAIGEQNQENKGVLELRKIISALEERLNTSAKENEKLEAAIEEQRKRHHQTLVNLKQRKKQCNRLSEQRKKRDQRIIELEGEITSLKTTLRNTRSRAKRYKDQLSPDKQT